LLQQLSPQEQTRTSSRIGQSSSAARLSSTDASTSLSADATFGAGKSDFSAAGALAALAAV